MGKLLCYSRTKCKSHNIPYTYIIFPIYILEVNLVSCTVYKQTVPKHTVRIATREDPLTTQRLVPQTHQKDRRMKRLNQDVVSPFCSWWTGRTMLWKAGATSLLLWKPRRTMKTTSSLPAQPERREQDS